jgi:cellulose biosynthesis protein BcsQ
MNAPVLTFFNNKGGVGKTSLVYNIANMFADLGVRVLAADLDPQCNLSAAFLEESKLEALWPEEGIAKTIYGSIRPLKRGVGDVGKPWLEAISENLALLPGDMSLSEFEDELSQVWPKCLDRDERAFRVISAFWRVVEMGAKQHQAHVVFVDLGPNLGAINRAALIASNFVVVPLAPDLFSLQGLRNLGPTLREWRAGWTERLERNPDRQLILPKGEMAPIGYVVMQHSARQDRPVKSYDKWISRIPSTYREYVLGMPVNDTIPLTKDPYCFGLLKHYRSLMPMAQESRKPLFHLKPADGALGSHYRAVKDARSDFEELSRKIATHIRIAIP